MKAILVIASLGMAPVAQASYYQINCSNGDATVQWHSGHSRNEVVLTRQTWESGQLTETQVELRLDEVAVEPLDSKEIKEFSSNNCTEGQEAGLAESLTIEYKEVSIRKADGSKFPEDVANLSDDGHSVSAHLICEKYLNSRTPCSTAE